MKTFLQFVEAAGMLATGEVVRAKDAWKILAEYDKPWHFVNFSATSGKLGLNPKFTHRISALAVYGYKVKDVLTGNAFYATNFPYGTIFTVKPDAIPYIIDLPQIDKVVAAVVSPIVQKMQEKNMWSLHLGKLSDDIIQEISVAFKHGFPAIPDLFLRVVGTVKIQNVQANIPISMFAKNPFSSLIGNLYGKEWFAKNGSSETNGSPLKKRKLFTDLGIRGILAGGNWSGGRGTSHGVIDNECIFFYPTDLKILDEIQTHKGTMASGNLNRNIVPQFGTPEKNHAVNQNLLQPKYT